MATPIRVVYGSELNTVVDGSLDPAQIFSTLKDTYPELRDGTYSVANGAEERVMTITLNAGRKA